MAKARIIVEGLVQGVGYRATVRQAARLLGVKGLVRNLPDGRAEIFYDGPEEALPRFTGMIDLKGIPGDLFTPDVKALKIFREGEPGYSEAWRQYEGFEIETKGLQEEMEDSLQVAKGISTALRTDIRTLSDKTSEGFEKMDKNFQDVSEKYGLISEKLESFGASVTGELRELRKVIEEYLRRTG